MSEVDAYSVGLHEEGVPVAMRVWELARKLDVESREVLASLKAAGFKERKTASSGLTDGEVAKLEGQMGSQSGRVLDFDGRTGTGKVRLVERGKSNDFDFDLKWTKLESSHFEPIAVGKSVRAKLAGGKVDAMSFE